MTHPVDAFNEKNRALGVVTYLPPDMLGPHFRDEVLDAVEHGGSYIRRAGDVLLVSRTTLTDDEAAGWRAAYDAMLADDPRFSRVGPLEVVTKGS